MSIPAVRIYQDRRGQWQALDVLLTYSRPQPVAAACDRVRAGGTVFVAEDDAAAVLAVARGEGERMTDDLLRLDKLLGVKRP